jgi:hypothetical protein
MNKQYQNDLEASLYYAHKEIDRLKKEKQFIIDFIENECVYDKHLQGYCFDLPKNKVRSLMFKINKENQK